MFPPPQGSTGPICLLSPSSLHPGSFRTLRPGALSPHPPQLVPRTDLERPAGAPGRWKPWSWLGPRAWLCRWPGLVLPARASPRPLWARALSRPTWT